MSGRAAPRVTIAMPVFNEAAHVDAALRSLRAQDYPVLRIVVCDNASTDDTLAICRQHAAQDARISIETTPFNLGVTGNFRRAAELADGDYFMWASGHDLWDPTLVSDAVALLEAHPEASLAYASSDWIDRDGQPLPRRSGWTDTRGQSAAARFFTVLWGNMHPVLGVIRLQRLREAGPLPAIVGGDLVLLASLALAGDFLHVRRSLWYRRELRDEVDYAAKLRRYTSSGFGVARSGASRRFPLLALPFALGRTVLASTLPTLDKALVLLALPTALALRYVVGQRRHA